MNDRHAVESTLLGNMMASRAAVVDAIHAGVDAEDFSSHGRGLVYMALRRIYARGDIIDTLTLANELTTMSNDGPDMLAEVGGRAALVGFLSYVHNGDDPERLARRLRELAAAHGS